MINEGAQPTEDWTIWAEIVKRKKGDDSNVAIDDGVVAADTNSILQKVITLQQKFSAVEKDEDGVRDLKSRYDKFGIAVIADN